MRKYVRGNQMDSMDIDSEALTWPSLNPFNNLNNQANRGWNQSLTLQSSEMIFSLAKRKYCYEIV